MGLEKVLGSGKSSNIKVHKKKKQKMIHPESEASILKVPWTASVGKGCEDLEC